MIGRVVASFLVERFGLAGPAELAPVARGAMGAVWRLQPARGPAYAVKELFWFDPGEDRVADELGFVDRCRAAGVPSPRAVATPDGRYVVTGAEGWWRLYEWVDGTSPARQDPATADWLMAQMARIHALGVTEPAEPVDPWYQRIDVDWPAPAERVAGLPWADRLTAAVPRLAELTELVNRQPAGEAVWCHRDLNGSNVLAGPGGRWLVDWDNAGPLEPWREFGALLTEHLDDHAALTRLARSYAAAGGPATSLPAGPAMFATGLAIWLNFLAGQAEEALRTDSEHRSWATDRVDGLLGPFPTDGELTAAADLVSGVLQSSSTSRV
jgi:Phosphotransferase enzyme family